MKEFRRAEASGTTATSEATITAAVHHDESPQVKMVAKIGTAGEAAATSGGANEERQEHGNEVGGQEGSTEVAGNGAKKMRDLPQLEVYFKMLRLGVPPQAVKLKMSREGFDPELIDDPEAPAPERLLVESSS